MERRKKGKICIYMFKKGQERKINEERTGRKREESVYMFKKRTNKKNSERTERNKKKIVYMFKKGQK